MHPADTGEPYLAVSLTLDPAVLATLFADLPKPASRLEARPGFSVAAMTVELMDAWVRMLRLMGEPDAIAALAPVYEREIIFRVLQGPHHPPAQDPDELRCQPIPNRLILKSQPGEVRSMQPRFVLVPAVPIERESFHVGARYYAQTVSCGFDVYDNREKVRLKKGYPDRAAGDKACAKMNEESRDPAELFPRLGCE